MTREDLIWSSAYARAWERMRHTVAFVPEAPVGLVVDNGEPMPSVMIDRMCRREADACVATWRAGEAARGVQEARGAA